MSLSTHRKGLTLLELVVVLVILIAVAGILVPLLPGMLGRAHTAEHSTNVTEINKAIESYNVINRQYPDQLDSLAPTAILPGYAAGSPGTACGGDLTEGDLSGTGVLDGLKQAGITKVWTPTGTDLVSKPYGAGTVTTLAATTKVAVLSLDARTRLYNDTSADAKYVVFGLGPRCDMVGKPGGIPEAPLHFSDEKGAGGDPNRTYSRYGLVFRVADSTGAGLERAQFVGTLALHEEGVAGASEAAAEFHKQNPQ